MIPLIKSGQEHVLSPINLSDVEVASRAQAEKEVREQEIIELQTEAANLEAVSNKATAMAEKIGGLLS